MLGAWQASSDEVWRVIDAQLHLWLLRRQVERVEAATATSLVLNATMKMLNAATTCAAWLAEGGRDVQCWERACSDVRAALDAAASERALKLAADNELPTGAAAAELAGPGSWRCPRGVIPAPSTPDAEGGGLEEAKKRSCRNLGSLRMLEAKDFQSKLPELLALLRSVTDDMSMQHALCSVERVLFQERGFDAHLTEQGVEWLLAVVEAYRMGARQKGQGRLAAPSRARRTRGSSRCSLRAPPPTHTPQCCTPFSSPALARLAGAKTCGAARCCARGWRSA